MRTFGLDLADGREFHACIGLPVYPRIPDPDAPRSYQWIDCVCIALDQIDGLSDADLGERVRTAAELLPGLRERSDECDREDRERWASQVFPKTKRESRPSNLYLMRSNGLLKIGVGQSVQSRRKALTTASGYPVELVASWPMPSEAAFEWEAYWHTQFTDVRMAGEWFQLSDDHIAEMHAQMTEALP